MIRTLFPLLILLAPAACADRIDGKIQSAGKDRLCISTENGTVEVKLTVFTVISWSNTWHSLEALPAKGLTAQIRLDADPEKALLAGPAVLRRARSEGVIALHARCLSVTSDDRVDHLPTGDYPVWVGLLKKDKQGNATLTVEKKSYKLEIKAKKNLGWFFAAAAKGELKKGRKVVVIGSSDGNFVAEKVLLPGKP